MSYCYRMVSQNKLRLDFLASLSDQSLLILYEFCDCVSHRARGRNQLDIIELERYSGITPDEIEIALEIVRDWDAVTHPIDDTSSGIIVTRVGLPIMKTRSTGEHYLDHLLFFPLKELDEAFSIKEIQNRIKRPRTVFYDGFDAENFVLFFAEERIPLSRRPGHENHPGLLVRTLVKDIRKKWPEIEVLEDWEQCEVDDYMRERIPRDRIYQAALAVNQKVAEKTQVTDFIDYAKREYRIDPHYLRGL